MRRKEVERDAADLEKTAEEETSGDEYGKMKRVQ